jgi:DNA-binding NarL/FixJ family response regulator
MTSAHAPVTFAEKHNIHIDIGAIQEIANAVGGTSSGRLSVIVIIREHTDVPITRVDPRPSERVHVMAVVYAGADGSLTKAAPGNMLRDIEEAIQGGTPIAPSLTREAPLLPEAPENDMPGDGMGLTERQIEVLSLLARGLSYKMIGEQLDIAMGTVNGHVRKIYGKLRVHSVAGAVGVALKHGLV